MVQRDSVYIEGFHHANPLPHASRIGNLMMSGVIVPRDAEGNRPDTLEEQCALIFRHVKELVEAAGGTTDNIIKMTFWLQDPSDRTVLNAEWTRMFPDPDHRPTRHSQKDVSGGPNLITCDVTAVFD